MSHQTKTNKNVFVFEESEESGPKKKSVSTAELGCFSAKNDFISHRPIPPLWQYVGGFSGFCEYVYVCVCVDGESARESEREGERD